MAKKKRDIVKIKLTTPPPAALVRNKLTARLSERWVYTILIVLLLIGLYLRLSGTLKGYFAFTFDQGRDFLVLHEVVNLRNMRLIGPPSGIEGVFHGVWWYWFLAPLFFLFRGNPMSVVAAFGTISTLATVLAYLLGKSIKDTRLGMIGAGLVSVSPFFVGIGAQLWNPNLVPLLILGFLLSLWQFLVKKRRFFWIMFFLGAIFEFHIGFGAMLLLSTCVSLLLLRLIPTVKQLLLSFGVLTFWGLPRVVFDFRNNFLQLRSVVAYVKSPIPKHNQLDVVSRAADRLQTFFQLFTDAFAGGNKFIGIIVLIVTLAGIVMILKADGGAIKKFVKLVVGIVVCLFIIASFYPDALWGYYLIGIPPLILPLTALAWYKFIKNSGWAGWIIFILLLIYLISPWKFFSPPWEGDAAVYKNQLAVVDTIYQAAGGRPFNVSVYSPSLIDYSYQYLFLWYGKNKYGYNAEREKIEPLVFFIIEPDPWNKGLRDIWIRERQGDGEIDWSKNFSGGIMVEKRLR